MKLVVTSGYFDPLHIGHIRLIEQARTLGDSLTVIVNSDKQAVLKKGGPFMRQEERLAIIKSLKSVDDAVIAIDDDRTVNNTLALLRPAIFAKGGDSTQENVPETELCEELGIEIVYGIGGDKLQSSSWLVKSWSVS